MRLILIFGLLLLPQLGHAAAARFQWQDDFTEAERAMLTEWVEQAGDGLEMLIGPLRYRYRVEIIRDSANEPVPWGETNKGNGRLVRFHVDPSFSADDFENDWTAAHELVHLMFPYLGEDSRWFAEGIASYLQYQTMYLRGTLTWKQAVERMEKRLRYARYSWAGSGLSVLEHNQRIKEVGNYPRLYWGGAAYFLTVDQRLFDEKGMRLAEVISDYVDCCYQPWGIDALGMMAKFNELSDSQIFTEVFRDTVLQPGFPKTADALVWLRSNPPLAIE